MAYRYGEREQLSFLPPIIEDYVSESDPVRVYDAFVETLDLNKLGIVEDSDKVGNPCYHPRVMLKLLVYGYSYGTRSSRKLERAVYHNLSFIWLMGGLKPDHKTIAEFRRNNKGALKKVLKQCAHLCIKLGLIAGNTLFVDGSKIRGNASIKNSWTKEKCNKVLSKIDKHIESILTECERTDQAENAEPSMVKIPEKLKEKQALKTKVEQIFKELEESKAKSLNTTDPECTRINSLQGSHAGYNVQSVVDEKHGLIVNADVVNQNNDFQQFAEQVNQANQTLEEPCKTACADSGYDNTKELEKIDKQNIKVIVPPRETDKDKKDFVYDKEKNCYFCPEGHVLKYRQISNQSKIYLITDKTLCIKCRRFGKCTKSKKQGRLVSRLINEEIRQKIKKQYEQPESQTVYKLRARKVELPFGHIKRNLGMSGFLIRGKEGAKAEVSLLSSCFNIARMITIFGVPALINKLANC
jgi:transposase